MSHFEWIGLAADIATVIGLVVAVVTYVRTNNRERDVLTYDKIDELMEANETLVKKDLSKDYMDFVRFTRKVDRFATLYNGKMITRKIVRERAGKFLLRTYEERLAPVIEQQRSQFQRSDYYIGIEQMIAKLR